MIVSESVCIFVVLANCGNSAVVCRYLVQEGFEFKCEFIEGFWESLGAIFVKNYGHVFELVIKEFNFLTDARQHFLVWLTNQADFLKIGILTTPLRDIFFFFEAKRN